MADKGPFRESFVEDVPSTLDSHESRIEGIEDDFRVFHRHAVDVELIRRMLLGGAVVFLVLFMMGIYLAVVVADDVACQMRVRDTRILMLEKRIRRLERLGR
jgi:hypothetical protein